MKTIAPLTLIMVIPLFAAKLFNQDIRENSDRTGDLTVIVDGCKTLRIASASVGGSSRWQAEWRCSLRSQL